MKKRNSISTMGNRGLVLLESIFSIFIYGLILGLVLNILLVARKSERLIGLDQNLARGSDYALEYIRGEIELASRVYPIEVIAGIENSLDYGDNMGFLIIREILSSKSELLEYHYIIYYLKDGQLMRSIYKSPLKEELRPGFFNRGRSLIMDGVKNIDGSHMDLDKGRIVLKILRSLGDREREHTSIVNIAYKDVDYEGF